MTHTYTTKEEIEGLVQYLESIKAEVFDNGCIGDLHRWEINFPNGTPTLSLFDLIEGEVMETFKFQSVNSIDGEFLKLKFIPFLENLSPLSITPLAPIRRDPA